MDDDDNDEPYDIMKDPDCLNDMDREEGKNTRSSWPCLEGAR